MSLLLVLALAIAPPPQPASASSEVLLRDYLHTQWTQHDGVPLGWVVGVLQTGDGYLWVITREEGLLRFDGMRFVPEPTPCRALVTHATSSPDGGFWGICGSQLIRRDGQGRFSEVPQKFLRPRPPPVPHLLVDRQGRPWFIGESIRHLERDGSGERVLPRPTVESIRSAAFDIDGTLWVSDTRQVVHIYPDRTEAVAVEAAWCLSEAREGGVYAVTPLRAGARPLDIGGDPGIHLGGGHGCMTEARDSSTRHSGIRNSDARGGGAWITSTQHGVVLLRNGIFETLPGAGLRERSVESVLVDREGTIWVGATSGLHRYRKPTALQMPSVSAQLESSPAFVFVDSRDDVWISPGPDKAVSRLRSDTGAWTTVGPSEHAFWAIGEDAAGRIWLSNTHNIGYVDRGRFVAVKDAANASVRGVSAFKRDGQGRLWAIALGRGVYQVTPGSPRLAIAAPDADADFHVSDRHGIWLARDAGLEQHAHGRVTRFPDVRTKGVDGHADVFAEDADSIWIGTRKALKRWRQGVWTTWTRDHGLPGEGNVEEIIADRQGHLWLLNAGGLLRVSRAQLDATPDGEPRPLSFARLSGMDGVVPHPGGMTPNPRATADRRGRLYFATADTIVVVDPAAIEDAALAPPIALESVTVDNRSLDPGAASRFVEPSRLRFDYTSLSLRSPENARFRYRLEGYDPAWIDAGGQRHVTYGTLRPGSYRFRVIGAGSEGVWNEQGASFTFQIAPVFWRTWWFTCVLLASAALMFAGLHRLRVRQLTRQFNLRLEARVGERTRIARDLHDTLLQTFQGVLIHFQAATNLLPARPDDAKRKLERVLDQAADAITEARDAVQALRAPSGPSDDLAKTIGILAGELAEEHRGTDSATIHVNVEGRPQRLRPIVRDDVYRIASEAVRNAMRHARARTIQADIHYDERHLRVRIRDDGQGIDEEMLAERGASGHWGLPGMRERAELIGGRLEVRSRLGSGTEVDLSVPASRAYAAPAGGWRRWIRRTSTEAAS
jgi:signal transduction histidine kinase/ligand-binding sensor domain-containing protein